VRHALISAVGEAFNNIALHGYEGRPVGPVEVDIECTHRGVRLELRDYGASFDPADAVSPNLEALPEGGLGVFIMSSMVDELEYLPGAPNRLRFVKNYDSAQVLTT
jgi:serine/threonine-protein kinase RsbW